MKKETITKESTSEDQIILQWLQGKGILRIQRLPGDASTRRYYRVESKDKAYIVMARDDFSQLGETLPFLEVQSHLKKAGIDVPVIFDYDAEQGFMLLEDLGDTTLLRRLQEVNNPETERKLYQKAIDALLDLQVQASPQAGMKPIQAYNYRFDREKLFWEMENTIEHLYLRYLGRTILPKDLKIMNRDFGEICQTLADEPTVLAHRDYHSRNLMMVGDERMVMIDFQDARLGPKTYDLVSLLRDSYYQLEERQIDILIEYYIDGWNQRSDDPIKDPGAFRKSFDLMAIQRNFKAIGSFASFLNTRKDPGYLKFIGNTFENVRRALLRHSEYSDLREVLFHYYYF